MIYHAKMYDDQYEGKENVSGFFSFLIDQARDPENNQSTLVELARMPDGTPCTGVSDWDETLRLALDDIRKAELMDRILTAWLPQLDQHIRLADLVLFHYVRRGAINAPMSVDVLQQWREKCIDLAVQTGNESLVESIICTVGNYKNYPALDAVVRELAGRGSHNITRALQRQGTCL